MNARYATSAIAVLLAVIVGYLAYLDLHAQNELQHAQRAFSHLSKGSISEIGIGTGDEKVVLRNLSPIKKDVFHAEPLFNEKVQATGWQLLRVPPLTPPEDALNDFLTSLVSLSFNVRIPSELIKTTEDGLGFVDPFMILTVRHARGDEILRVGNLHPHGDKRYALIGGRPEIYLIPARIVDEAMVILSFKPA